MNRIFITLFLIFSTVALSAQNYSPCYTNNMKSGNEAYAQGKYSEAKTHYAAAKQCKGGNPEEAQKKINSCDAKIKAAKEAQEAAEEARRQAAVQAEEQRRAEAAAAERRRREDAERANRRTGYMKKTTLEFASVDASGTVIVPYLGCLNFRSCGTWAP